MSPRPTLPSLQHGIDRDRLHAVLSPIVEAHGGEVTDVEFKSESGGWVLRVFVEKLGSKAKNATTQDAAVSLDLCSNVAKELSPALDVADLIPHRYNLEVGSPGVERPLHDAQDFERFAGLKARLKVHNAVRGQKVLVGVIGAPVAGMVPVQDGGASYEVPLDNISAARLVFEFGPAPRPGQPGKGRPTKTAAKADANKQSSKQKRTSR
jgi:ribosome maturation factor RimP